MENVFYNSEIKEQFLDAANDPISKAFTTLLFKKTKETEEVFGKDLYDMTEQEIGEAVAGLACSTANAVYNNVAKIEEYVDWAAENGYRKTSIHPLSAIGNKYDWGKKYVAEYKNEYFTRDQFLGMLDKLYNVTDRAVLLAIFEGIRGKGYSELFNLKPEDITEKGGEYWVHLKDDDGEERDLQISRELANILMSAHRQENYYNRNGENKKDGKHIYSTFENSPYIFKKTARGSQKTDRLNFSYVSRKFVLFKDVFNLPYLKPKHIVDSGIMHYANELQKDEELTTNDLYKIADRFDMPFTGVGHYHYRNTTNIRRVLATEAFEELYGYKMKFKTERVRTR